MVYLAIEEADIADKRGASLQYSTAFLHRYFFTFTLSNNLFRSSG